MQTRDSPCTCSLQLRSLHPIDLLTAPLFECASVSGAFLPWRPSLARFEPLARRRSAGGRWSGRATGRLAERHTGHAALLDARTLHVVAASESDQQAGHEDERSQHETLQAAHKFKTRRGWRRRWRGLEGQEWFSSHRYMRKMDIHVLKLLVASLDRSSDCNEARRRQNSPVLSVRRGPGACSLCPSQRGRLLSVPVASNSLSVVPRSSSVSGVRPRLVAAVFGTGAAARRRVPWMPCGPSRTRKQTSDARTTHTEAHGHGQHTGRRRGRSVARKQLICGISSCSLRWASSGRAMGTTVGLRSMRFAVEIA
jgi:hypothetical protein